MYDYFAVLSSLNDNNMIVKVGKSWPRQNNSFNTVGIAHYFHITGELDVIMRIHVFLS